MEGTAFVGITLIRCRFAGAIGDITPGQTKALTATLAPGTYTAMCNLPGHLDGGMHLEFVVQ